MSRIAFQGEPGAYGHLAAAQSFRDMIPMPCPTFEDAFAAVQEGEAALALIPIENSLAGRVADVHHLLPTSGLHVVGERFMPIRHQLLGLPGARIEDVRLVRSHAMALGQCRRLLRDLRARPLVTADTAGAARELAELKDPAQAAIASNLAAEIHGLHVLRADVADDADNITRFVALSRAPQTPAPGVECVTSLVFRVRNVPAALFKALGGFATNGVNLTKIESYQEGAFRVSRFYLEFLGRPNDPSATLALEELAFFSEDILILGVYPADAFRSMPRAAA